MTRHCNFMAGAMMLACQGPAVAQHAASSPSAWEVQDYRLSAQTARPGLDLAVTASTDNIIVYGERRARARAPEASLIAPLLGGVTLSGTADDRMAGFSGMTVTASVPIKAVLGMSAGLNFSAGHDTANPADNPAAAAVTAGVKLAF